MGKLSDLYERYSEAKAFKDRWLALYKELYWYVIPNRDAFNVKFNYDDQGKPVTQQIYDDTAVVGAYQRANDLHGLLMPKDRTWGRFVLDPHTTPKQLIDQTKPLVDEMNDRIFFYLNQSNLSRVVSSSNLDLIGGTGVIWVESVSDEVPLYFRSCAAVATYIEYSTDDLINTCWYESKSTGHQILKDFPDYNGTQLENIKSSPNQTYSVNYGQVKQAEDSYYIYGFMDEDPEHLLFEHERIYPQIIIYRDRVRPGEAEGRGIGTDLLPTIRDLNRMVNYRNKNYEFKAYPPMFYDSGDYFNPWAVRQWAGMMIPRTPGGRNPLQALEMPSYPDTLQCIQDSRNVIREAFMIDPLGEINSPVRSATEISVRENRAQRTSATDISRLINELPAQIFDVAAKILYQRNLLMEDRRAIPGFNTKKFRFDFVSPLYDIQNQEDINHFVGNMQIKQQFWGEEVAMATLELPEANKFLNDKFNLPAKLFKTGDGLTKTLNNMVETAREASRPPQPSTSASPVNLPQQQGVTI